MAPNRVLGEIVWFFCFGHAITLMIVIGTSHDHEFINVNIVSIKI